MQHIKKILLFIVGLITSDLCFAYDMELDGLRYDYKNYNVGYLSGYGELHLVGFANNMPENLSLPSEVQYKKGLTNRRCIVSTIASGAFKNCSSLKRVVDTKFLRYINGNAFENCSSLQSVNLGNVYSIGLQAFTGCTSLQSVNLGNVYSIGSQAFTGCTSLESVFIGTRLPSVIEDTFDESTYHNAKLIVPEALVEECKTHEVWSKFDRISTQYTASVTVTGNITGNSNVFFNEEKVNINKIFSIEEGRSITLSFSSVEEGHELSALFIDDVDVTSSVVNNQYVIDHVSKSINIQVSFYSIKLAVSGNGHVTCKKVNKYNSDINSTYGDSRNETRNYTVPDDSYLQFYIYPDDDYRISKVISNKDDITSQVNTYWPISSETFLRNTTLEVFFEEIPPVTYTLTIKSEGNGIASYEGTTIREKSSTFNVNEGSSAIVYFTPDTGYSIKSVKVNNTDVTANVSNNQYTISSISADTSLEVEFEAITHTLSITATGNGVATYNETSVRGKTSAFTVNEGTSAVVTFTPDTGYRIASVKLNGTDVTASVVNNKYTISSITANTTLAVTFETDSPVISFADANVKSICIAKWDTNSDGELSEAEAAVVNDIGSAFCNNKTITSLNELKYFTSLRSFEEEAFSHCTSLTSIFIPRSVTYIGLDAFADCSNLKKVIVSDIAAFCNIKFEKADDSYGNPIQFAHHLYKDENTEYTELILPETVKSIPDFAFYECYSFTRIYLPNSITVIGDGAFQGCKNVKSVVLSNSLTAIPLFAFRDCSSLESVEIPNGVKTIGLAAFRGCTALTSVVLPKSLTSLNYTHNGYNESNGGAFENCSKLSFVKSNIENPFEINSLTFEGISTLAVLEVPQNTKSLYLNKKWTNYFNKIKELSVCYFVLSVSSSAHGVVYCNDEINDAGTYFVSENSKVTIKTEPDTNYCLKKLLVNNEDVTNLVDNNHYILNNIASRTIIKAEFEEIPIYSLNLTAIGNGNVGYDESLIRNQSQSYTVREGSSITMLFAPDAGYQIASVTQNGTDVTSSVSNNSYTISSISGNTSVEVKFEAIPYTLSIKATGNGTVTYDGTSIREKTSTFTVTYGSSAIVKFTPDTGYRIKSVKLNNVDVTSNVADSQYTINNISADTSLEVEFETIPYTLSVKATGNGTVTYDGTSIREKTSTFTVTYGSSAVVSFTPDAGYRIKGVKVNNTDVTSAVSNGQYTITNITADASLEVEFEAIPPTTYSFTIKATGNGTVTYDGTVVRGKSSSFTVNEGTSATVSFSPDSGYRIKSVKLNNTDVTSSVSNGKYTISNITANTTLDVEFEVIPPTTYTFTVKATGNGTVTFDGTAIRGKSSSFTVNEGTSAIVTFTPDSGNRIKSVKLNNTDVTSIVSNGKYTISNITSNTTLDVEFEVIPPTTYTFTVKATGNGTVTCDGTAIRGKSSSFTVNEGTSATVSFSPDSGYRIKSVKLNNTDVTSSVSNSKYTISNITSNTTLDVEFDVIPPTTYTFTVKATGNGTVTFDGTAIRGKSSSFTVNEGTSAIVTFTPDTGNRIKSVKLNNTDVTSSVSNGKYTISNITANTTLDVEFEVIPTYTLNIVATGNGNVTYNGTVVRNQSQNYSVREGSFVVVSIVPDAGYRVASAKINSTDVTGDVSEGKLSISNITSNKTIEIAFEAIPPTTYTLTVKAEGNGMVLYDGATIRNESNVFTVVEGTYATLTITPDEGNRIKSVKVNSVDNTSNVKDGKYTINSISANTVVEVVFEPLPTLTFTIKATGNGKVAYNNTDVRGKTAAFTVNHGTSATVTFTPDTGNRIKSVKLNNTDVTSGVSNGKYTISSITANTTLDVEFEVITYTLSVKATGNGSATYSNTPVRDKTTPFTVNHGTSATVTFTPDTGNRIKSVKLNNTDVTSSVSNGKYTISNITANTTLDVEFEAIPTYTLNIVATGNGNVTYNGTVVRNQSQNYSVREGSSVVVSIVPDAGYRVASAKINSTDVTGDVSEGKLSISNITSNKTIEIAFEAIPPTTYALTVKAEGNGMVLYDGATIRNESNVFTVAEGTYATLTITPDEGNRIKSVKVNSVDNTSNVTDGKYTVDKIKVNTIVEVIFEEKVNSLTVEGVSYAVISQSNKTVMVASGNYGQVLTVPATVTQNGTTWTVTAVDDNALKDDTELAAVIWNPTVPFTATVSNPNLLLYVTSDQYAPASIKNVVVNGVANSITLVDAASGNGFCCPQAFTAKSIIYNHTYNMTTGIGESRGWETIALPFDVQSIRHESKGEMIPFIQKKDGNGAKPFWLYELTGSGFVKAGSIKAYTPYIISMPHHQQYDEQWHLNGRVTFSASNVTIAKTEDLQTPSYMDRTFIPCFTDKDANEGLYVLNVNNDYSTNNSGMTEGSKFVLNMRQLHPFEAYMTTSSNAKYMIDIFEDMPNAIDEMESVGSIGDSEVFDLQGRKILAPKKGVYIKNRRKYIK